MHHTKRPKEEAMGDIEAKDFDPGSLMDNLTGGLFNGRKPECCIADCTTQANVNTVYGLLCVPHDTLISSGKGGHLRLRRAAGK